jgi:hypothetical protein
MRWMSSLLVLLAGGGTLLAAGNAEIKQVSYVKKQESAVVKAIKARYHAAIQQTHRSEEQLARERSALAKEEAELVKYAATDTQKDQIRAQYELLRESLRGGVKLDREVIDKLRQQESAVVKQVQTIYRAQVKELEAQIKTLEQAARASRPARRK